MFDYGGMMPLWSMKSRLEPYYFPQLILNILYPISRNISQFPMASLQSFTLLYQLLDSLLEISGQYLSCHLPPLGLVELLLHLIHPRNLLLQ